MVDRLRGLAASIVVLVLVAGPPVGLTRFVGWPLPTSIPGFDELTASARTGIDDMVIVNTLAVLGWLAWAQIALAFVIETASMVRNRQPRQLPLVPGIQPAAAQLLATAALLLGSIIHAPRPAALPLVTTPAVATAPLAGEPEPVATNPAPALDVSSGSPAARDSTSTPYTVKRHDSWWGIAEDMLGDGARWREIRSANLGGTMSDGTVIGATTDRIEPGWVLLVPSVSEEPVGHPQAGAEEVASASTTTETVRVQPGDHLWSISEDSLERELGRDPTDDETAPRWLEVIDINRSRLVDPSNPSLIYPGQEMLVPSPNGSTPTNTEQSPQETDDPPPPSTTPEASGAPNESGQPTPTTRSIPTTAASEESVDATEHSTSQLPTGLLGVAGAALAAGLSSALLRRRRGRLTDLPPGTRPPDPPAELDDIRTALVLAADEDEVTIRDAAVHELAAELAEHHPAPRPLVLQVSDERVEALLTGPARPSTDHWEADATGTVWSCATTALTQPDDETLPAPALVAIGEPEETGQLYLDLEAAGLAAIAGESGPADDLARSMLLELAHQPSDERVDIITVGGDPLTGEASNVKHADDWTAIAEDIERRAKQSAALLEESGAPHAFTARLDSPVNDSLTPLVVFLDEPPNDDSFTALSELVAGGGTTVTMIVRGQVEGATSLLVERGVLHAPDLGLACRVQGVTEEAAEQIDELLADAEHLPEQLPLLSDDPSLPTPSEEPEVIVRFLGDIEVDILGSDHSFSPKQTALLAYLALHAPVPAERVEDAIWTTPTASRRKRLANTASECRMTLGAEHLPLATEGRYTVGPRVATDLALFDEHIDRAEEDPDGSLDLLQAALELVRGPVFTYRSLDRSSYVWIDMENWLTTWELKVSEAALRLAHLALDQDEAGTAAWAAQRGLVALPTHAGLTEALMKAYAHQGDCAAAETVFQSHVAALEQLEIDDVAETTIDLRDEIRRGSHVR